MVTYSIFYMVDSDRQTVHTGLTTDLQRVVQFYQWLGETNLKVGKKLNCLVYNEETENEQVARERFEQMNSYTKDHKLHLIKAVNPEFEDYSELL